MTRAPKGASVLTKSWSVLVLSPFSEPICSFHFSKGKLTFQRPLSLLSAILLPNAVETEAYENGSNPRALLGEGLTSRAIDFSALARHANSLGHFAMAQLLSRLLGSLLNFEEDQPSFVATKKYNSLLPIYTRHGVQCKHWDLEVSFI